MKFRTSNKSKSNNCLQWLKERKSTLEVLTFFFLSTIDDILSTSCFPPGIFLEIAPAMTIAPFVISHH
jgi:hypothetical protein